MRWITAVAMMIASGQAIAAPVYLDCKVQVDKVDRDFLLALDEGLQTALITTPGSDNSHRGTAIFTTDYVKVQERVFVWTIDRSTLDLSRLVEIGDRKRTDRGKCAIAKAPANRAF